MSSSLKLYERTKCVQVLKYIVKELTRLGIKPDIYKVLKILYLADKVHLLKWGKLITSDNYIKMAHGPVPCLCSSIIRFVQGKNNKFDSAIKKEFKILKNDKLRNLTEPNYRYLAKSNINCLKQAIKNYGQLNPKQLEEETHNDGIYNSVKTRNITVFDMAKVLDRSGALTKQLLETYPNVVV
jgi:uncharacterized phage-associated protein